MKMVKIAAVTILVLSIPHQAPMAGPTEGTAQGALGDQTQKALPRAAGDLSAARSGPAAGRAMPVNDGFVWSVEATGSQGIAWGSRSEHLETDGYSWSARFAESDLTLRTPPR